MMFDLLHKLDRPFIVWRGNNKEYWINNKIFDAKEVEPWIEENNIDLKTKAGKALFKLKFG